MTNIIQSDEPVLYNRITLFLSTVFLSTLFGSILYAVNLHTVERKKDIPGMIVFGILWNALWLYIFNTQHIDDSAIRLFVPNLTGAIILSGFAWNYHFKEFPKFINRSVLIPLVTVLLVYGLFIGLILYWR